MRERMNLSRKLVRLLACTAGILCLLVYMRTLHSDFVNLDDQHFVINSEAIRHLNWKLIVWAFTTPAANWVPLTHVSFAIDYYLWGLNPVGYHLTNIILHAANTAIVVLIADRLYQSRLSEVQSLSERQYLYSAMLLLAGLLFAVHPLRVESVAWVTERKDVLNGIFSFGAILFYLRYAQKKMGVDQDNRVWVDYAVSCVLFLVSLTAKTMSVTIPVLLLIIDWYPLGRLRSLKDLPALITEKLPFILFSATASLGMLAMTSQRGNLLPLQTFPFDSRLVASGNAVFEYVRLLLFPFGISPLHIIPNPIPGSYALKSVLVVIITVFILYAGIQAPVAVCHLALFRNFPDSDSGTVPGKSDGICRPLHLFTFGAARHCRGRTHHLRL